MSARASRDVEGTDEAYALVEIAAAGRLSGEARKPEGVVVVVVEGSEPAEAAARRRRS